VIGEQFPDRFLSPVPGGDAEAWAWARQQARRLPPVILACLDPFTLRDRLLIYEGDYRRHPERGALANLLLLRAVLDQAVAWQTQRAVLLAGPERGSERGQGVRSGDRPATPLPRSAPAGDGVPVAL
jgi:hypothetical protein